MLNIGKLSPGDGEYYIGEIATSAEGYYAQRRTTGTTAPIAPGRLLDVAQAASFLGVSAQYVRFLLKPGEEHRDWLASASPDERGLTRSCWWGSGTRPSGKRSKEGSRRLLQTGGAIAAALPASPRR